MRNIEVIEAFNSQIKAKASSVKSTGTELYLFGNCIAKWINNHIWITNAGWDSRTTKKRLNQITGVNIHQKNYKWYLNEYEWNGTWTKVKDWPIPTNNGIELEEILDY